MTPTILAGTVRHEGATLVLRRGDREVARLSADVNYAALNVALAAHFGCTARLRWRQSRNVYDVEVPVRPVATSIESALRSACDGGVR